MASDDEDRPKRSWREIDQMRDGSAHRKEVRPQSGGGRRVETSQAYRAYKTQLNRLFDGGGVPAALKEKLAEANVGADAKARKEAGKTIVSASGAAEAGAALEKYKEQFGFPSDEEVLARLLDLSDETVVHDALSALTSLRQEGVLKKATLIKAKIKTVLLTVDEPEIQKLGKELLASL